MTGRPERGSCTNTPPDAWTEPIQVDETEDGLGQIDDAVVGADALERVVGASRSPQPYGPSSSPPSTRARPRSCTGRRAGAAIVRLLSTVGARRRPSADLGDVLDLVIRAVVASD